MSVSRVEVVGPRCYNKYMSNTETIIFDLDDTLADTSSMRDGVRRPIDEQMLRMSAADALPLAEFAASLDCRVIIMTARTDSDFTRAQVARYGIKAEFLFRPVGDNRDDHHVKRDLLTALLATGANVTKAFDDKIKNVEMFRSFGIDTVHV